MSEMSEIPSKPRNASKTTGGSNKSAKSVPEGITEEPTQSHAAATKSTGETSTSSVQADITGTTSQSQASVATEASGNKSATSVQAGVAERASRSPATELADAAGEKTASSESAGTTKKRGDPFGSRVMIGTAGGDKKRPDVGSDTTTTSDPAGTTKTPWVSLQPQVAIGNEGGGEKSLPPDSPMMQTNTAAAMSQVILSFLKFSPESGAAKPCYLIKEAK